MGRAQTIGLVERCSALTHLVSSAEYLVSRHELRTGGIHDWQLQRTQVLPAGTVRRRLLDAIGHERVTVGLHVVRVVAAGALLAPAPVPVRAAANAVLAATAAALYPRHHYGTDGSDQVGLHVQSAMTLARAIPVPALQDAALWYLAMQSTLGYAVSGWVKLAGRPWRDGSAVAGVMRTRTYGNEHLWRWYRRRPRLAAVSAHTMLVFECGFPLLFVLPRTAAVPFALAALAFHLGIGVSMGLGRFVTAFAAMLPAVVYARTSSSADTALPKHVLGGLALVLFAGAVSGLARRSRMLSEQEEPGVGVVEADDGVRLVVREHGRTDAEAPVVVLECGLLASPAYFAWIIEHLAIGHRVVTYSRAGIGASGRRTGCFTVEQAAADLCSVVRATAGDAPVYLAGHSIGGLIARAAAGMLGEACAGLVYLDSSHPAQLERSVGQRRSSALLGDHLATVPSTVALGLGWALTTPEWLTRLPLAARVVEQRHHRDARLWRSGLREWRGMLEHFADPANHELAPLPHRALVLTASRTGDADAVHIELQQDLAWSHLGTPGDAARGTVHRTIDRADHLALVTHPLVAAECGAAIADFIAEAER